MSTAITKTQSNAITPVSEQAIQYRVALNANLWGMPDQEVYSYYRMMCGHLRLDPASHPFDIINDAKQSQKKLYLNSIGTSQLGDRARLSYGKLEIDVNEKLIALGFKVAHVSLEVKHPDGRSLVAEAFVDLMSGYEGQPLKGNNLINALKKAGTQCRRRGTLQMLGMMPQDAEVPTIQLGEMEREGDGFEGVTIEQLPDSALLEAPVATVKTVTPEAKHEAAINTLLIDHYSKPVKDGGKGPNGKAFVEGVWLSKPIAEREAEANRLGLITAPALEVKPVVETETVKAETIDTEAEVLDERGQLLIEIDELIESAKAAPLNRTAKEVKEEIKRQMTHDQIGEMNAHELATLKDGLTLWLKNLRKK